MRPSKEYLTHLRLTGTSIVYESSSLPFIFGSSSPGSGPGMRSFKGRRNFANGQEKDLVAECSSQPLETNPDVRERRTGINYLHRRTNQEPMEAPSASRATQRKPKPTKGISRQQTQATRLPSSSDKATIALPYDPLPPATDFTAPAPAPSSTRVSLSVDRPSQFLRPADVHVPRPKSKRDMLSDIIKSSRESAKQSTTPPVEALKPSSTSADHKESKRKNADPADDLDRPRKKTKRQKTGSSNNEPTIGLMHT